MINKSKLILVFVFLSFIALGLSEGAVGVSWPNIRYELDLPLGHAGIIMIIHAISYSLAGSQLGRIARSYKLERIDMIGLFMMASGFFTFSLAPNFPIIFIAVAITGSGMGFIDSSLNTYMAKNHTSRYMNWLHCFWGLGAAASPVIMVRLIIFGDWRLGFATLATIHLSVAIIVLISIAKKTWVYNEGESHSENAKKGGVLTKSSHQFLMIFIFFLYVGAEHSIGFWITSVMLESRGLSHEAAAMFPSVYFAMIMAGRMFFGFVADKFKDMNILRFGFALSVVGLIIQLFTDSIIGIALIGFGFAPIFPCLVNDTANRFNPAILTKLVGYEIAAVGAGIAIISALMGQILYFVSMEALFPGVIIVIVAAFLTNEIVNSVQNRAKSNGVAPSASIKNNTPY